MHKLIVKILCLLIITSAVNAEKVLILSGGGARGLAHIGVIRAMEEKGIEPDRIIATSMGAIVGALYATGYNSYEIEQFLSNMDVEGFLSGKPERKYIPITQKAFTPSPSIVLSFDKSMNLILPSALLDAQGLYSALAPILSPKAIAVNGNFQKFDIPLTIVTTDLLTGNTVLLEQGDPVKAVIASSTIPLAFPPVEQDSLLLVDGGIKQNIPIIEERVSPEDTLIVVDVTSPLFTKEELVNPVHIGMQVVGISIKEKKQLALSKEAVLITPTLDSLSNDEFGEIKKYVAAGYKAATNQLPAFASNVSPEKSHAPTYPIQHISIDGNSKTRNNLIKRLLPFEEGDTLTEPMFMHTVSNLYGTNIFKTVHMHQHENNLKVTLKERNPFKLSLGARADETYKIELFAAPEVRNLFGLGMNLRFHLQYGEYREKYEGQLSGFLPLNSYFRLNYLLSAYISSKSIVEKEVEQSDSDEAHIYYKELGISKSGTNFILGWDVKNQIMLFGGLRAERYSFTHSPEIALPSSQMTPHRFLYSGITADYLNSAHLPTKGGEHYLWISGAFDVLGSEKNFFTISSQLQHYFTVGSRVSVAPSMRFLWSDTPLPTPSKHFIGGSRTKNRLIVSDLHGATPFAGVEENKLPADRVLVFSGILRYQISKNPLFLSLYGDWGIGWNASPTPLINDYDTFSEFAPVGIETELAYSSPAGPIRLSWSRIIYGSFPDEYHIEEKNIFHFSVGYNF